MNALLARFRTFLLFPFLCAYLVPTARAGDAFIGAGTGVKATNGPAFQVALPVLHENVELHYLTWDHDGRRSGAANLGYRFEGESPLSLVVGIAYVSRLSENLLRHANAYFELRAKLSKRFSCAVGHYSTVGDDMGENLLLCGVHWGGAR
ncbi:MAG TPA: hypothetical protein VIL43_00340 [Burkholderiales bacterium]